MTAIHSYSSIYALGHDAVRELLIGPVLVEEKIDGSQFSFCQHNGEWEMRSKGANIVPEAPPKLFARAVEYVLTLPVVDGYVYRGEVLDKPHHNVLTYERTPKGNIILFDIGDEYMGFLPYDELKAEGDRLGLEVVPLLFSGILTREHLETFLTFPSLLGGQIEGVVIKPLGYDLYGRDKKVLMGKFVAERFKEVASGAWRVENPTSGDIIERIVEGLRTTARWEKAIQHLRERDELLSAPQDIGPLLKEIAADILVEEKEEILQALFNYAWPQIKRRVTSGFPEWYKAQLFERQFEKDARPEVDR